MFGREEKRGLQGAWEAQYSEKSLSETPEASRVRRLLECEGILELGLALRGSCISDTKQTRH